jgi:coatomer subunit beta'
MFIARDLCAQVWQLGCAQAAFTLEGHEKGVNCIDYYTGGDKPYLISGADDRMVRVWDYQTKSCVHSLEGHVQNVTAVAFHPELPLLLTGSEDGTVRVWHAATFRLETTLNYGLERVWSLACQKGNNHVAIGYDEGASRSSSLICALFPPFCLCPSFSPLRSPSPLTGVGVVRRSLERW